MITKTEINFVRDILLELSALADPSEYIKEEVDQAIEILDSLHKTKINIEE